MRNLKEGVEKLPGDSKMYTASSPHLPQMFCFEQHPNNSEQFGGTQSKSAQESHLLPRNVVEGHSEALCLGIWEGKLQVARECQPSEKEKANDQAPELRKPGVQELSHERSSGVQLIPFSFHNMSNTDSLLPSTTYLHNTCRSIRSWRYPLFCQIWLKSLSGFKI